MTIGASTTATRPSWPERCERVTLRPRHPRPPPPGAAARNERHRVRAVLWGAAVLLLAVGSGVVVARTSGTRTAHQEISGFSPDTTRERLDGCLQQAGQRRYLEAVRCYTEVLADEPSSAEALTYRAWTLVRVGDERLWAQAGEDLDAAVGLDPTYRDARVFRAVLRRDQGRADDARADLEAFDSLGAPPQMRQLVDQLGLRQSLAPATPATPANAATSQAPATPATTGTTAAS